MDASPLVSSLHTQPVSSFRNWKNGSGSAARVTSTRVGFGNICWNPSDSDNPTVGIRKFPDSDNLHRNLVRQHVGSGRMGELGSVGSADPSSLLGGASSSSPPLEILVCDDEADFQQYGADSGCVEPRTSCDHLASLSSDLTHIPTPDTFCNKCQHPSENWLCLCCKEVLCSRFVNKHMLQHYQQRNHCLALSYSDLSVWCFACDSYLDAQVILQLRGVYETAYILKFGEAPPFRTPVEPPSSSLDHQARDCSSGS